MSEVLQVRLDETVTTVTNAADGTVTVHDTVYTIVPITPGVYRVSDGHRRWTVAVAGDGDTRWVFADGVVARLEVVPAGRARQRRAGTTDQMVAPMPATVVSIRIEPGDQVAAGDTLIVLEAMKMELPVRALRDGIVKEIRCAEGDLVQPGVILLELV